MLYLLPPPPAGVPLAGLYVGGCVERGVGSSFRAQAHAHWAGPAAGWVCVRSWRRLVTARGGWSQLMLHEFAHLVAPGGHHDRWRAAARALGYRLPAQYRKRQRATPAAPWQPVAELVQGSRWCRVMLACGHCWGIVTSPEHAARRYRCQECA